MEGRSSLGVTVEVRWGSSVLRVLHLSPPRSVFVGEGEAPEPGACGLALPGEALGRRGCVPLLLARDGGVWLVLWPGAAGFVEHPGQAAQALAEAGGQPCAAVAGARQVRLPRGAKAQVEAGGFVFEVRAEEAAERARWSGPGAPGRGAAAWLLSALAHVGLLAAAARAPGLDEEIERHTQQRERTRYLEAAFEREQEQKEDEEPSGGLGEEGGTRAGKFQMVSPPKTTDPAIARQRALGEAWAVWGELWLMFDAVLKNDLRYLYPGWDPDDFSWGLPRRPWTWDKGEIEAFLRPRCGWGECAPAEPWKLLRVGEIGSKLDGQALPWLDAGAASVDAPEGCERGQGCGLREGARRRVQFEALTVVGRLPEHEVRLALRQGVSRMRACYERALRQQPALAGRVRVRFVVDQRASVDRPVYLGSDLPDRVLVGCILRSLEGLSFPQPAGGLVTVQTRIWLSSE